MAEIVSAGECGYPIGKSAARNPVRDQTRNPEHNPKQIQSSIDSVDVWPRVFVAACCKWFVKHKRR